jgi:choice-of-anchor B domain-containing protein
MIKQSLFLIALFTTSILISQTPCVGGMAGSYPCNGFDLQSEFSLGYMNASQGNDSWGWTDPQDGKEYALIGLDNGTAFIDISDPVNPVYLGKLPTHTSSSSWRDVKTYNNYAFIVSEASGHGMQVFDLTRLRNVNNPPQTFTEDAHYNGIGGVHNIVINPDIPYAFTVGGSNYGGGPHFINISDPLNPVGVGGYSGGGYSHDGQIVIYNGPDADYTGREIYVGSNTDEVVIVDVTNKANPQSIATISYSNSGYTHQGWFTEDQRYFIVGDEFDENNVGFNTRSVVLDFTDLDNPQEDFEYFGPTPAIDHNGYVKGNEYYLANYTAGLRVIDISDISNGNMTETGYFDSFPSNNNANYNGSWNVYPYFGSGNIVISDMSNGFLLVKSSAVDTEDPVAVCQNISAYLDENGDVIVPAEEVDGGSSDNSGFFTLSLVPNTFDCSDLGANSVTLTVTDSSGNTDTCSATVTIVDDMGPQFICPSDDSVIYDDGQSYYTLPDYVAEGDVSADDNCTANLSISQDPAPGTQLTEGVYTISFESSDDEGNTTDCSFELTVDEFLSNEGLNLAQGLSLYPNPANNTLFITSKYEAITSISIIDIQGKILYSEENLNNNIKSLDVSSLSKGIYFVKLNHSLTKKIIKN